MHRLLMTTGVFCCALTLARAQQQAAPLTSRPYGGPTTIEQANQFLRLSTS